MTSNQVFTVPEVSEAVVVGSPSLQFGDAVFKNAITQRVEIGNASFFDESEIVGIINSPATALGGVAEMRFSGIVQDVFAGFQVGAKVFLATGGVTGATLTQTPFLLEDDNHSLVVLGVAHTPTDLLIKIQPPVEF